MGSYRHYQISVSTDGTGTGGTDFVPPDLGRVAAVALQFASGVDSAAVTQLINAEPVGTETDKTLINYTGSTNQGFRSVSELWVDPSFADISLAAGGHPEHPFVLGILRATVSGAGGALDPAVIVHVILDSDD